VLSEQTTAQRTPRGRDLALLFLVALLATLLRLYHLGFQSLWYDECEALQVWQGLSKMPLGERTTWLAQGLPLHDLLMASWIALGTEEFTLRLPSALFGVLTVPASYALGTRLIGRSRALVVALLVALSPFHVWYSQEARPYAMLMFLATVSALCFLGWLQRGGATWWWSWIGASVLCVLTFRPAAYILIFQGMFLVFVWRAYGRRFVRTVAQPVVWVPALILFLIGLPWVFDSSEDLYRSLFDPESMFRNLQPVSAAALPYTFFALTAGFSVGPSVAELHLPGPLEQVRLHGVEISVYLTVFSVLLFLGCKRLLRQRERFLFVALYIAVPIAVMWLLSVLTGHAYNARYAAPALIPYLFVIAAGLCPEQTGPRSWWTIGARSLAHLLCYSLLLGALYGYYLDPKYAKIDSRSVAATIEREKQPGDVILLSVYWYDGALPCYLESSLPVVTFDRRRETALEAGDGRYELLASHPRTWLVSPQPWSAGREEGLPPGLGDRYGVVKYWDFPGVRLSLLEWQDALTLR